VDNTIDPRLIEGLLRIVVGAGVQISVHTAYPTDGQAGLICRSELIGRDMLIDAGPTEMTNTMTVSMEAQASGPAAFSAIWINNRMYDASPIAGNEWIDIGDTVIVQPGQLKVRLTA